MTHFLVDTNIWSETVRSSPNAEVIAWLRKNERQLYVSAVSIGEIKSGIESLPAGKRKKRYQTWLSEMCRRMDGRILSFNTSVAIVWGQLIAQGNAKGIKFPAVDSQIAATAKRHSLVIATRNVKDFANTGIKTVNPFDIEEKP